MNISPETQAFIRQHADEDVRQLALRYGGAKGVDLTFALNQIQGRQTALRKLPSWAAVTGLVYPPHLSMEQCSSEQTGHYKQQVVRRLLAEDMGNEKLSSFSEMSPETGISGIQGSCMVDLTGGFGVDFSFLSPLFRKSVYVEQQAELCDVARHNFPLLGLGGSEVVCAEAEDYLSTMSSVDLIYMDPARRDSSGARTYGIADCTPNVLALLPALLAKSRWVVLKLSPMLDITGARVALAQASGSDKVRAVHVVAVDNECKELLLVLTGMKASGEAARGKGKNILIGSMANEAGKSRRELVERAKTNLIFGGQEFKPVDLYCVNDGQGYYCQFSEAVEGHSPLMTREPLPGEYLFEPNAALMKAGCFSSLCADFHLNGIGTNSHLFVGDHDIPSFPGRRFIIEAISTMGKVQLRSLLSNMDRANITVRNFPLSAVQLRQRLKLRDGGDIYLFGTTLTDRRHVLIVCKKTSAAQVDVDEIM